MLRPHPRELNTTEELSQSNNDTPGHYKQHISLLFVPGGVGGMQLEHFGGFTPHSAKTWAALVAVFPGRSCWLLGCNMVTRSSEGDHKCGQEN